MTIYEQITILLSTVSIIFSVVALFFSRKDKPNLMPVGHIFTEYHNVSHLSLKFLNGSDKVIYDPILIMNNFDIQLNELKKKYEHKYYYYINGNSEFDFTFEITSEITYSRIRLSGKYNTWFPFIKYKYVQEIWYSFFPIMEIGDGGRVIGYNIYNTYDENIEKLKIQYKDLLKAYDKKIDKTRW